MSEKERVPLTDSIILIVRNSRSMVEKIVERASNGILRLVSTSARLLNAECAMFETVLRVS